jgi:transcriptional regulator with XRE-family HTH domain
MIIQQELRDFRKSKTLTQQEASDLLGVGIRTYQRAEYKETERAGNFLYMLRMIFTICPDKETAFVYVENFCGPGRNKENGE